MYICMYMCEYVFLVIYMSVDVCIYIYVYMLTLLCLCFIFEPLGWLQAVIVQSKCAHATTCLSNCLAVIKLSVS